MDFRFGPSGFIDDDGPLYCLYIYLVHLLMGLLVSFLFTVTFAPSLSPIPIHPPTRRSILPPALRSLSAFIPVVIWLWSAGYRWDDASCLRIVTSVLSRFRSFALSRSLLTLLIARTPYFSYLFRLVLRAFRPPQLSSGNSFVASAICFAPVLHLTVMMLRSSCIDRSASLRRASVVL